MSDANGAGGADGHVRQVPTDALGEAAIASIRALMLAAFGADEEEGFTEADWAHSVGGRHFLVEADGAIVGHASVVERVLEVGGHAVRTGYVEAVAVDPDRQGTGIGSLIMADVGSYIRERFELGALGTGSHHFYERLGWFVWAGPAFVRTPDGEQRTPDEEGDILVLPTPTSPPLDRTQSISCDWRPGDVW